MELFVDDHKIAGDAVVDGTLEDALKHLQSKTCAPGRMVVTLRCDGSDVPADQMVSTLKKPVSSFDRLEVFTSTEEELVTQAMAQASISLTQTEAECLRIADCLTEGKTADGMEALGECMGVWQQIHEAVSKSIQMLALEPEQATLNDKRLIDMITEPTEVLLQIKQALQSQDHVLLADTLKYEFTEVTHLWHAVITWLRREAEERRVPAGEPT